MQVLFFLNAAMLSRKILVKTKYQIGTRYWLLLNIKDSDRDPGKSDRNIPN